MKKIIVDNKIRNNQDGIAAFFVTLMVMVIFGILILSFSQISNRAGANALNRVLSSEALYAAQSGINNTYSIIKTLENEGKPVPQQSTSCSNPNYSGSLVGDSDVKYPAKYTCIVVNTTPKILTYDCLHGFCPNNSIVAKIESVQSETVSTPLSTLDINWTDSSKDAGSCTSSGNTYSFPSVSTWGNCLELLRVDLVPFISGTTTVADLQSQVATFYLYPQNGGSSTLIDYNGINIGDSDAVACGGTSCSAEVTGLTAPAYYIRIQYYYGTPDNVNFTGYDSSGTQLSFSYSQIQIDSTGVSSNGTVIKRLSANIDPFGVGNPSPYSLPLPPNYAVQSNASVCKSLIVNHSSDATHNIGLYEIIPPNSSLDPYTDLNYQLTTTSPTQPILISNYAPTQPSPSTPFSPAPVTVNPVLNSTAPLEIGQTEVTSTNVNDSCNPI